MLININAIPNLTGQTRKARLNFAAYRNENSAPRLNEYIEFIQEPAEIVLNTTEQSPEMDWSVYPNPVYNEVNISCSKDWKYSQDIEIEIFDIHGVSVLEKAYSHPKKVFNLNITALSNGIYFLSIRDRDQQQRICKVVKQQN